MKRLHFVKIRVIAKDDEEETLEKLKELIGFDPKEADIEKTENDDITVFETFFRKTRNTNRFIKNLREKLGEEKKKIIDKGVVHQNRVYVRLDKEKLLNDEFRITDKGDCFHIRMSVAAYPRKKEVADKKLKEILQD